MDRQDTDIDAILLSYITEDQTKGQREYHRIVIFFFTDCLTDLKEFGGSSKY